ncbi:MAG TPA: thioredoxin-disulfide reductase [Deltaproteobacteria bacterium]|nr:MAG: thioredoxin reductase [bacterium]HDH10425.1 thioredoxin-disulfide reductase [Deltaproteobacteria bacterium]
MLQLAIIGGGVAGLSAAIYAARYGIECKIFEQKAAGGQIIVSANVENYPGVPGPISGFDLIQNFEKQVKSLNVPMLYKNCINIRGNSDGKTVEFDDGSQIEAKAVIIATGASPRKLNAKNEAKFIGRGISFCATCDGFFFKGKDVAVVGGGDSAIDESLFLSKLVNKIYVIHRRDQLRASKILQEKAFNTPNIKFLWSTVVETVNGEQKVESLALKSTKDGSSSILKVDGVFIYIGLIPASKDFCPPILDDKQGYIVTDSRMSTNIKGVFAAGDVRVSPLKQLITAASDGAVAADSVNRYLIGLS